MDKRYYPAYALTRKIKKLSVGLRWSVVWDSYADRYTIRARTYGGRRACASLIAGFADDPMAMHYVVREFHWEIYNV